jgi:acid phosphatase (class A)
MIEEQTMARSARALHSPKLAALLTCAIFLVSCMGQEAVKPAASNAMSRGAPTGYLQPEEVPNSLALLPPPPENGSAMFAQDEAVSKEAHTLRDTPRWKQATLDAVLSFPQAAETFSCALDAPVTQQDSPRLYAMLLRMFGDTIAATSSAKNKYARARPFMVYNEPTCAPGDEASLRTNGSYPSGHTTIGWAWALVLAEVAPDRSGQVLARGRSYGESRIVCNAHWQSDILQGRFVGASVVARLHANTEFRSDVEAAKKEFVAMRAKGLKPTRDCAAEAQALSQKLKLAM